MFRSVRCRLGLAAALAAFSGAALAQSGPVLPKMPMPPSFNDPKPVEKPGRKPAASQARPDGDGQAAARPKRSDAARSGNAATTERPARYVPEEFDRNGAGSGGATKPFVSETGRPGMGMRF